MSATTDPRNTRRDDNGPISFVNSYPLAAGVKLIQGCMAGLKNGSLVQASADPAISMVGVPEEANFSNSYLDNTLGSAAIQVNVRAGTFIFANSAGADAITLSSVGEYCYAADNQTVALTAAGGTRPRAGIVINVDSLGVHVEIRPSIDPSIPAADLPSQAGILHQVRGCATANVANLAAFTVAGNDSLTYTAGQRVLLIAQTTKSQNGIYVVGTVTTGTAPLTRADDFAAGMAVLGGTVIEVNAGTLFGESEFKVTTAGTSVIDTDPLDIFPRSVTQSITLVAGTATIANVPVLGSKSNVLMTRTAANTSSLTVGGYGVSTLTAGVLGTASVVIQAQVAAGTINVADVSTLQVTVQNF